VKRKSHFKGRTYEEIYGPKRAKAIKSKISDTLHCQGSLSDERRNKISIATKKAMSREDVKYKMSRIVMSSETKLKISQTQKKSASKMTKEERSLRYGNWKDKKLSENHKKNIREGVSRSIIEGTYQSGKGTNFTRKDLGCFFRSKWEANIARILNYISKDWQYEKKVFYIRSLNKNYIPDFFVSNRYFIEVKGYMRDEDSELIDAFKREYSDKILKIIDWKFYKRLTTRYKSKISNWEE